MNCPNCHTGVVEGAKFCPKCGTPIGVGSADPIGQTMASVAPGVSPGASLPRAKSIPPAEIAGRYRISEKLGEGAMGTVYRGEQISLKRPVAVKLLKASLSTDKTLVRRFNAEAEAVAKLSHPNTVNIHDFGQEKDGSLFIVMELVEGVTLRKAIDNAAPFSPQRTLFIAAQIAASIGDAHARSIIHRDLKPDNVMLQTRGRVRDIVRVLDFGIAKLRDDNKATMAAMTQAGDMLGTPQYMAPEQVLGDAVDGRVDIYALGCIIYEMVTARRVFDATSVTEILTKHLSENVIPPSQRRPDLKIPPEIDRLVMTATMKQAAARPPSMEVYGEQIAAVLAAMPREPGQSSSEALPVAYAQPSGALAAVGPWATPPAGTPNVAQTPSPAGRAHSPSSGMPAERHSPSSGLPQIAPTVAVTPPGGLPPANRAHTPSSQLPLYGRATPSGALPSPPYTPPAGMPPAQTPSSGQPPAGQPPAGWTPPSGQPPAAWTPSSGLPPAARTPSSGLPPASRTPTGPSSASSTDVGQRSSSRGLLIALLALVVGAGIGGGVFLALRKNKQPATKVATNDHPAGSATPSAGSAVTPPVGNDLPNAGSGSHLSPLLPSAGSAAPHLPTHLTTGSASAGSAIAGSASAGSDEPVVMSDDPPGQIISAASGFKFIVPTGFTITRRGNNVYAQAKGYTIVVGPIVSKLSDPEAAAKEYANATHLTLDGVVDVPLNGVQRPGAALHGKLYGDEVAQSIISYIGINYRVVVSLTMPYAARNDPTVRAFADELFAKRVIPPSP